MDDNQKQSKMMELAENGDWSNAIALARQLPKKFSAFENLAPLGVPPEHLDSFVDNAKMAGAANPQLTFELAANLHPDLTAQQLIKIQALSPDDYFVKRNIKDHPNFNLSQDPMALGAHRASEFLEVI